MTSNQRRALLATIIGSGVVFLDSSVVTLALPKMADALGTGLSGQQWVVDGYALTLSALILLGGSLGDIYGQKKVYFWGAAGFGLASLACAVSPTIGVLIAARIAQGVFGAMVVPGSLALIDTNFESDLRGKAIGLWTAATSGIIAVGPLVGGYLIDVASWRWIFLINAPLLALVVWLGAASIKESRTSAARRIDIGGALLAVAALAGITYGLIEGPMRQWPWMTLAILGAGIVAFVAFLLYEARHKDPMVPLRLFRSRNFVGANAATFAMYGGLGGFFFALVIYLQTSLHYTSIEAGLAGLPVSILLTTLSGKAGALSGKYGPRLFMTFGPVLAGVGILTLLPLHAGTSYWLSVFPGIVLFGLGMALTVAPLTTTVFAAVSKEDSGIASGINNAMARVSSLVVVAVLGILGAAYVYQFAVILCGCLALGAGLLSFWLVRNPVPNATK